MRQFFDAHVYLANWGEAVLMLRLPREAIDAEVLEPFAATPCLEIVTLKEHWLLTWSLADSEDYDRLGYVEGEGWMARLAPLREELLRGDLRSLYLGWLGSAEAEGTGEDEEPPVIPAGLGELTAAQQALAEFLDLDVDLLAGAAMVSSKIAVDEVDQAELDDWLERLPKDEVHGYLRQMLAGQGAQAERALKRRHAAWRDEAQTEKEMVRRTVDELCGLAEQAKGVRLAEEAEARLQDEAARKKKRADFLAALANDFPRAWEEADSEANRGTAKGYDAACRHLVDLRDAYTLRAGAAGFQGEFRRFMMQHSRRRALVERLVKAGLCERQ